MFHRGAGDVPQALNASVPAEPDPGSSSWLTRVAPDRGETDTWRPAPRERNTVVLARRPPVPAQNGTQTETRTASGSLAGGSRRSWCGSSVSRSRAVLTLTLGAAPGRRIRTTPWCIGSIGEPPFHASIDGADVARCRLAPPCRAASLPARLSFSGLGTAATIEAWTQRVAKWRG